MKHTNSRFLKFSIFMTLWVFISTVSHGIMAAEKVQELPTGDPAVSCFGDPSGFQLPGVVHTTVSNPDIPKEISAKMHENIVREDLFRAEVPIGVGANIAQLSIFLGREGVKELTPIELPVPTLFLSGIQPTAFPGFSKQMPGAFNTVHEYQIGTSEPAKKTTFRVVQRTQPNINGVMNTLTSILSYVGTADVSYKGAVLKKREELSHVCDHCQGIIKYLEGVQISPMLAKSDEEIRLYKSCVESIQRRNLMIRESLGVYDLSFSLIPGADEDPLIKQIREELRGGRSSFQDLFISQYVNLACSEQLIVDILNEKIMEPLLRRCCRMPNINQVTLHIHTTMAPCKACVLKILSNLERGTIRDFFSIFKGAPIRVFVSYSKPYQEDVIQQPEGKKNLGYEFFISDEPQYELDLSRGVKKLGEDQRIKMWIVDARAIK